VSEIQPTTTNLYMINIEVWWWHVFPIWRRYECYFKRDLYISIPISIAHYGPMLPKLV